MKTVHTSRCRAGVAMSARRMSGLFRPAGSRVASDSALDALMEANLAGNAVNATDMTTWQTPPSRKD